MFLYDYFHKNVSSVFLCCNVAGRFFRALLELERSGLLPSSIEEANHAASRIRLRSTDGAIMVVLPEVSLKIPIYVLSSS